MKAITYQISLTEPLLATTLGGDPNSAITHHYIPGSMIRGLLAKLFNQEQEIDDLTGDPKTRPLLFDGTVCYLNAYPSTDGGKRSLPIPASWQMPKIQMTEKEMIQDFAFDDTRDRERIAYQGVEGFVAPEGTEIVPIVPTRQISIHTLRNRSAGRPDEEEGTIYRYEALAANQTFCGAIIFSDDAPNHISGTDQHNVETTESHDKSLDNLVNCIVKKLSDIRVHLGGSHTAGYGLVQFSDVTYQPEWNEEGADLTNPTEDDQYIITLLSDTILRDPNGQLHTDLGKALRDLWSHSKSAQIAVKQSSVNLTAAGGFNRTWGLPLPQTQAIRAGSLYTIHLPSGDAVDKLNRLIESGIGERRIDGFGRVAVNWQNEERKTLCVVDPKNEPGSSEKPTLSPLSSAMARRMATRRRRRALDRRLEIAVLGLGRDLKTSEMPLPSKTQLSRVRIIARSALKHRDLERIATLFRPHNKDESTSKKSKNPDAFEKAALEQFRRTRIQGKRLNLWIKELAEKPESVWSEFDGEEERKSLIDSEPEGWMAEEYAIRLIDGVMAQAIALQKSEGA